MHFDVQLWKKCEMILVIYSSYLFFLRIPIIQMKNI